MNNTDKIRRALAVAVVVAIAVAAGARVRAASNDAWGSSARYEFSYRVDFSRLAANADDRVRVWVPYAAERPDQTVLSATIEAPWPYTLGRDRLGNRMLYLEGRGRPKGPLSMRFTVERSPSHGIPASEIEPDSPEDPQRYLYPARMIPLGGIIGQAAEQHGAEKPTTAAKARAFYDYVVTNLRYNKQGSGWGRGDAVWACDNKRGNCTDFHSLFIGMARSRNIPARFVIGFPIPRDEVEGSIGGYHCWAEYFEEQRGWRPLDASEASKAGKSDAYFGTLPNDRIEFTVGRDLLLEPAQNGPLLNYFIYPYVEVAGKPAASDELARTFSFRRLSGKAEARASRDAAQADAPTR